MASIQKNIVVTGLAGIHPMGNNLSVCSEIIEKWKRKEAQRQWYNYCFGNHPIGRISENTSCQKLTPMEKRFFDRITMVVYETVRQCIEDADLKDNPELIEKTGIISGSAFGCLESQDRLRKILKEKGPSYFDPVEFPFTSHNFPISAAAIKFCLKGPITAMVCSMSAGLNALIYCAYQIIKGQAQRMIAIAFDEITDLQYAFLKEKNYLTCATNSQTGNKQLSVFPSECCVAWMLESEQSARHRKAPIYAKLGNWNISSRNNGVMDTGAVYKNIRAALNNGNRYESEKVYFVTNGSGYRPDDEAENLALSKLAENGINFKQRIRLKPIIGNCLGAASLMEGALLLYQKHQKSQRSKKFAEHDETDFLFNSFGMGSNLISMTIKSFSCF